MHILRNAGRMSNPSLADLVAELARHTAAVDPDDPAAAVGQLSRAESALTAAMDEAMALTVLAGSSVRSVADRAGIAPNSVSPRLARSTSLGDYAQAGRVDSSGIGAARYDTHRSPMRFVPRTSKKETP
jgi:lambda repressor-like predicted transcriptional regulator